MAPTRPTPLRSWAGRWPRARGAGVRRAHRLWPAERLRRRVRVPPRRGGADLSPPAASPRSLITQAAQGSRRRASETRGSGPEGPSAAAPCGAGRRSCTSTGRRGPCSQSAAMAMQCPRSLMQAGPALLDAGGSPSRSAAVPVHDLEAGRTGTACWIVTMADVAVRRRLKIRTAFPRARNRSQPAELPALVRSVRSSRVWVGSIVLGVLGTLLTGVLLALPGQFLNPLSTKDSLRSGPDFSVGIDVVRLDDEGRSAVTHEPVGRHRSVTRR